MAISVLYSVSMVLDRSAYDMPAIIEITATIYQPLIYSAPSNENTTRAKKTETDDPDLDAAK